MTSTTQSEPVEATARTRRPPRWIWASLLLLPILALSGLVHRATPSGPWEPIISKAEETARSPFGRAVFADGSITRDEYAQANNRVVDCARAKGVTFHLEDRYGLVIFSSAGSNEAATLDECESGDPAAVRSLYEEQYKDPRREGDVVYYRCLEGAGFPVAASDPPRAGSLDAVFDKLLDQGGPGAFAKVERCLYDPTGASRQ